MVPELQKQHGFLDVMSIIMKLHELFAEQEQTARYELINTLKCTFIMILIHYFTLLIHYSP